MDIVAFYSDLTFGGCHLSTWLSVHSTPEMRSAGLDLADILENWNSGEKLNIEDFL